ncbi:SdpA family antimicrobial peptide system protein [Rugosimonospora acidiphila]
MGTGSAVHEHRTTAPEGAGTTEIAPSAEPVATPQEAQREQSRLGRRVAALAVLALVVVVYVVQAALPVTAFSLPLDKSQQIRGLVPEGWAFFTKSPRIPDPTVYGLGSGGRWRTLTESPQADPTRDSLFGLDRLSRSQGTEVAIVTNQIPAKAWTECTRQATDCLSQLSPAATITNFSTHHSVCGNVGVAIQEVLPWAWHGLSTVMPSKVARVVVTC